MREMADLVLVDGDWDGEDVSGVKWSGRFCLLELFGEVADLFLF